MEWTEQGEEGDRVQRGPGDDIEGQAVCVRGLLIRNPSASTLKGKAKLVTTLPTLYPRRFCSEIISLC